MKRRILCALIAMTLAAAARAEGDLSEELVRLHVVADNDSPEAQALKLEVRDATLAKAQELLRDCESAQDAWETINDRLEELEAAARTVCPDARAETGVFEFPDREYGGLLVPAGEYRALRIVVGAGEGRNWWCVLYPTLCMAGDGEYYSILAEWFRIWFGGEGA